jgi:hypothetical protein
MVENRIHPAEALQELFFRYKFFSLDFIITSVIIIWQGDILDNQPKNQTGGSHESKSSSKKPSRNLGGAASLVTTLCLVTFLLAFDPAPTYAQCWEEPFHYDGDRVLVDARRLPELSGFDQDEDYLDDSFEYAIAEFYKPYLNCHHSDETCSQYGDPDDPDFHREPLVLYQVSAWKFIPYSPEYYPWTNLRPIVSEYQSELDPLKMYIYVKYAFLWTIDEGVGPCRYCDDGVDCGEGGVPFGGTEGYWGHYGDNQTFTLFFSSDRLDIRTWRLIGVENDDTAESQRGWAW